MSKKAATTEQPSGVENTQMVELLLAMREERAEQERVRNEEREKFAIAQAEQERVRNEEREKFAIAQADQERVRKEERVASEERFERMMQVIMSQKINATVSTNNKADQAKQNTEGEDFFDEDDEGFTTVGAGGRRGNKNTSGNKLFKQEYREEAEGMGPEVVIHFRTGVKQDGLKIPEFKKTFSEYKSEQDVKAAGEKLKEYYERGGNAQLFSIINTKVMEGFMNLFNVKEELKEDFSMYPQAFVNELFKYIKARECYDAEKEAKKIHLNLDTAESAAIEASSWHQKTQDLKDNYKKATKRISEEDLVKILIRNICFQTTRDILTASGHKTLDALMKEVDTLTEEYKELIKRLKENFFSPEPPKSVKGNGGSTHANQEQNRANTWKEKADSIKDIKCALCSGNHVAFTKEFELNCRNTGPNVPKPGSNKFNEILKQEKDKRSENKKEVKKEQSKEDKKPVFQQKTDPKDQAKGGENQPRGAGGGVKADTSHAVVRSIRLMGPLANGATAKACRVTMEVTFEGKDEGDDFKIEVPAHIDTCAESDFVSRELLKSMGDRVHIRPSRGVAATTANGSALSDEGGVHVIVEGKKLFLNVTNLKNAEIIIGMPSIKALGLDDRMKEMFTRSDEEHSRGSVGTADSVIAQINLIQITEQANGEGSGLSDTKWRAIAAVHNAADGHAGIVATLARLKAKDGNSKITAADVEKYIHFCDDCQRRVLPYSITNVMGVEKMPTATLEPWKIVYVDFLGPWVDGDSEVKFNYVAGFTDGAGGGTVLVPVVEPSGQEAARAALEFMAQKEVPDSFVFRLDNGPAFHSKLVGTLVSMIGAELKFGISYSHQDQTLIERMFREVNKHAIALVRKTKSLKKNPELMVPVISKILNNATSRITGFSPHMINQCTNKSLLPLLRKGPDPKKELPELGGESLLELYEIQASILAENFELRMLAAMKRNALDPVEVTKYNPGELVLLAHPEGTLNSRFVLQAMGPFEVIEHEPGTNKVTVRDMVRDKQLEVHVRRTKPYRFDDRSGIKPIEAAALDFDAKMVIGAVLDWRFTKEYQNKQNQPNAKQRRNIGMKNFELMVKWVGFEDEDTTWIPYDQIKRLEVVQKFVQETAELKHLGKNQGEKIQKAAQIHLLGASQASSPKEGDIMNWEFRSQNLEDEVDNESLNIIPSEQQVKEQSNPDWIESKLKIGDNHAPEELTKGLRELSKEFQNIFHPLSQTPVRVKPVVIKLKPNAKTRIFPYNPRLKDYQEVQLREHQKFLMDNGILVGYKNHSGDGRKYISTFRPVDGEEGEGGIPKVKWMVDFKNSNGQTEGIEMGSYTDITELLREVAGKKYKGQLDFSNWFGQIPLDPNSQHIYGVQGVDGEELMFTRLPKGAKQSSQYGQEASEQILKEASTDLKPYQDDCIFGASTVPEFLSLVRKIYEAAAKYGARINPAKTILGVSTLESALGRRLSDGKVEIAKYMKMKVEDFAKPVTVNDLQSFAGLTNYARGFIEDYAAHAKHLSILCPHKESDPKGKRKVIWNPTADEAYSKVKQLVAENEGLNHVVEGVQLEVRTDASNGGIGAVLSQTVEGKRQDIAFFSQKLNEVQARWPTIEQEAFAIYKAIKQWQDLLIKRKFKVFTDHRNLTFILNAESKKLTRWRLALQEFEFEISHILGSENPEADYLSRVHK